MLKRNQQPGVTKSTDYWFVQSDSAAKPRVGLVSSAGKANHRPVIGTLRYGKICIQYYNYKALPFKAGCLAAYSAPFHLSGNSTLSV